MEKTDLEIVDGSWAEIALLRRSTDARDVNCEIVVSAVQEDERANATRVGMNALNDSLQGLLLILGDETVDIVDLPNNFTKVRGHIVGPTESMVEFQPLVILFPLQDIRAEISGSIEQIPRAKIYDTTNAATYIPTFFVLACSKISLSLSYFSFFLLTSFTLASPRDTMDSLRLSPSADEPLYT